MSWVEPLFKMVFLWVALSVIAAYLAVLERAWIGRPVKRWPPPWRTPRTVWDVLREGLSLFLSAPPVDFSWKHFGRQSLVPAVVLAASFAAFATIPFGGSLAGGAPEDAVNLVLVPELPLGPLMFLAMNAVMTLALTRGNMVGWSGLAFQPVWLLALAAVMILNGSLDIGTAVDRQSVSGMWWLGLQPFGMLLVVAAALGDPLQQALPVAEPGCDGRLALARSFHLLAIAFLIAGLFLGGGHVWWVTPEAESATVWSGVLRSGLFFMKAIVVAIGLIGLRCARPVLNRWGLPQTVGSLLALGAFNVAIVANIRQFTAEPDWGLQASASWSVLLVGVGVLAARTRRRVASVA